MNGFEVWLFLVFIPNLPGLIFVFFLLFAALIIFGLSLYAWHINATEETYDPERGGWVFNLEMSRTRELPKLKKRLTIGITGLIISSLITISIPDRKEIAAIILIPYVSNNVEFQKIPENLAKKLNDYLTDEFKSSKVENND